MRGQLRNLLRTNRWGVWFPTYGLHWDDGGDPPEGGDPPAVVADWRSDLDPDIKDHPSLKDLPGVKELAKSYVHVQGLIGMDKIPIPAKPDAPEWEVVYDRLGRPKTPDEYELVRPENYPAELPYDEEAEKGFRDLGHKLGLNKAQMKGIYDYYMATTMGGFERARGEVETYRAEAEATLRGEWGLAYDKNLAGAQRVVKQFADEKDLVVLQQIGDNPAVLRFMAKIANVIGEDKAVGDGAPRDLTLTPDQAQGEIAKIMGNSKHPYFDKMHPEHKIAVERMAALNAMAHPEPAQ